MNPIENVMCILIFFLNASMTTCPKSLQKSSPKATPYECHGVLGLLRKQCKQTVAIISTSPDGHTSKPP